MYMIVCIHVKATKRALNVHTTGEKRTATRHFRNDEMGEGIPPRNRKGKTDSNRQHEASSICCSPLDQNYYPDVVERTTQM